MTPIGPKCLNKNFKPFLLKKNLLRFGRFARQRNRGPNCPNTPNLPSNRPCRKRLVKSRPKINYVVPGLVLNAIFSNSNLLFLQKSPRAPRNAAPAVSPRSTGRSVKPWAREEPLPWGKTWRPKRGRMTAAAKTARKQLSTLSTTAPHPMPTPLSRKRTVKAAKTKWPRIPR